jgi:hypothetical protein
VTVKGLAREPDQKQHSIDPSSPPGRKNAKMNNNLNNIPESEAPISVPLAHRPRPPAKVRKGASGANDKSFISRQRNIQNREYVCKICDKARPSPSDLVRHHVTHLKQGGDGYYKCPCPGCQDVFTLKEPLRKHLTQCDFLEGFSDSPQPPVSPEPSNSPLG